MLKILYFFLLFSLVGGPLTSIRIYSPYIRLQLTDVVIFFLAVFWLINFQKLKKIRLDKAIIYFFIFLAASLVSLLLSPIPLSPEEKIISFLYLVRITCYLVTVPTVRYLIQRKAFKTTDFYLHLLFVGYCLAVIGWFQYFLYPDLRNLMYLGWDPHYKRIFSTYFDPNFLGLIFVLTLLIIVIKKKIFIGGVLIFISLLFTYSRSSFLSLTAGLSYYFMVNHRIKLLLTILFIFSLSLFLLPRPGGVGVRLERWFSAAERIKNWQEAVALFRKYPILGVGFNTLRFSKTKLFPMKTTEFPQHSLAGYDNSFLYVLTTTGLAGFVFFILFLKTLFLSGNLLFRTALIVISIHSLFVNSFFLPQIMVWLGILASIYLAKDQEE